MSQPIFTKESTSTSEPVALENPGSDSAVPPRVSSVSPEQDLSEDLSEKLASALQLSELTQSDAAQQIGCSQSAVSKILRGRSASSDTAIKVEEWAEGVLSRHDAEPSSEAITESSGQNGVFQELEPAEPVTAEAKISATVNEDEDEEAPGESTVEMTRAWPRTPPSAEPSPRVPGVNGAANGVNGEKANSPSPYEAILRRLLEASAQQHLREIAGEAAADIVVRVSLDWKDSQASR